MSDAPFRERRISAAEARRVVQRAAELAAVEPELEPGQALTVAEIEERLATLGIAPELTRRALEPKAAPAQRAPDGSLRVEREIVIEGALAPERFDAIADSIAAAMQVPGQLSAVGSTLTWTPAGPLVEPKLTLRSRDGKTTIHYIETLANAGQQWLGFGTLAAFGGVFSGLGGSLLFAFLAMSMGFSRAAAGPYVLAAGGVVGVAMAVVTFLGLQRLLAKRADSRGAFADEVLISVARAVRAQLDRRPVKTRVDTATPAPDIEGEAAAEEALAAVEALEAEAARLGEAKE